MLFCLVELRTKAQDGQERDWNQQCHLSDGTSCKNPHKHKTKPHQVILNDQFMTGKNG